MTALSELLAKRLQGLQYGSIEYSMTWKMQVTPAGRSFFRLAASMRRTSDKEFSGWPTPNSGQQNDTDSRWQERRAFLKDKWGNNGFGMTLGMAAGLTGLRDCPTPQAMEPTAQSPNSLRGAGQNPEKRRAGNHAVNLTDQVRLVSGLTPNLSPAATASSGVLNPAFSLWLQGFPSAWLMAAPVKGPPARACSRASAIP